MKRHLKGLQWTVANATVDVSKGLRMVKQNATTSSIFRTFAIKDSLNGKCITVAK